MGGRPKQQAVREGTSVDLSLVEGRLIAVPDVKGRYTLKELLSKVTKDNLHKEVSFGRSVGREAW